MRTQSDCNRAATSAGMKRYWAKRLANYVRRCTTCKRTPDEAPFYAGPPGHLVSYCKSCNRERRRKQRSEKDRERRAGARVKTRADVRFARVSTPVISRDAANTLASLMSARLTPAGSI
jgi:hypothetical protein